MTIAENAQQLMGAGESVFEQISGMVSSIAEDLSSIGGKLQQACAAAEDSTSAAAGILGEEHPGTGRIIESAAQVVAEVERVSGLLQQFDLEKGSVTESGGQLRETFTSVAQQLMGG